MNISAQQYFELRHSARSWTEDFAEDLGTAPIVCEGCGKPFLGHALVRYRCRVCSGGRPLSPRPFSRLGALIVMLGVFAFWAWLAWVLMQWLGGSR